MITVEIYSALLDSVYDFRLDEFAEIDSVIEEVVQMFCQKNLCSSSQDTEHSFMYSEKNQCIFNGKNCLYDYRIKTGDRLVLI